MRRKKEGTDGERTMVDGREDTSREGESGEGGEVKRLCGEAEIEVWYLWYHTPLMMMTPLVLSPCRLAEYDSRRLPSFADVNLFRPDRKQSHCVNSTNPWVEPLLESFSPSISLSHLTFASSST